ncbi:MAG: ATP-binding protein [Bacteroidota bacterium]
MVSRIIKQRMLDALKPGKVLGLFGARRTGKTVLMSEIMNDMSDKKILLVHGENLDVSEILSSQRSAVLKNFVAGYDFLFIDEAQKIPNIGANLKLIVDTISDIGIFVTGSSTFDLHRDIGEPLTGRGTNFNLFPFAQTELKNDFLQSKEQLEEHLIFGLYPQVVMAASYEEKIGVLESIKNGYLLKDILELDNLKDSLFIINLLRLLAFQIGNDVSLNELAGTLRVNRKTVERYLELLQKCYIIFAHQGFSRNLRKEISKSPRFYFWDNGIRNAVIANYNRLQLRDDVGRLWENYCLAERLKMNHYRGKISNNYFWRTYDQKEIDFIEESGGQLTGFEFKWTARKTKVPEEFLKTYDNSTFLLITQENYLEFIS